jgi:hypothetical protein
LRQPRSVRRCHRLTQAAPFSMCRLQFGGSFALALERAAFGLSVRKGMARTTTSCRKSETKLSMPMNNLALPHAYSEERERECLRRGRVRITARHSDKAFCLGLTGLLLRWSRSFAGKTNGPRVATTRGPLSFRRLCPFDRPSDSGRLRGRARLSLSAHSRPRSAASGR